MPLDLYHAKRDFKRTPEPRGRVARKSKSQRLSFVVQRHAATRLHYDFRLELDGVLKSWAVTKVPSYDTATKRLAVEVEDHPLDYGGFEGTIPKGEYGGGTVQLWDVGSWEPREDPQQGLTRGNLKFTLNGKRLKGGWALIRMKDWNKGDRIKPQTKRNNWLLIKERDEFVRKGDPDALLKEDTSVKSGRTLDEIAGNRRGKVWHSNRGNGESRGQRSQQKEASTKLSGKDVKKNSRDTAQAGHAQEIKRVPIPQFVEPQLCRPVEEPPEGPNWVHEIKLDGYRLQLRVVDGKATLRTRKGLDWTDRFPTLKTDGEHFPDCLIDGEACALGENGVPLFEALQMALSEGNADAMVFYAFDLLFLDGIDLRQRPLSARKELLRELIVRTKRLKHTVYVEHFAVSGAKMLRSACEAKLEGIISKRVDGAYHSARRDLWTKAKCRGGQEVVIGGWWGDRENLRSIQVGMFRDGKLAYAGSVGTGFNSSNVGPLLTALRPLARDTSPFTTGVAPPRNKQINWVEPRLVAEVAYAGITGDGLVRQASFKGLREDKPARSVVRETPVSADEAEAMAEKGKRAAKTGKPAPQPRLPARGSDPVVAGVTITNSEKVLWPAGDLAPAFTKLDLALYYEKAADHILPHLELRPVSLVRGPDGIEGQRFFQRHVLAGVPAVPMKVRGEPKPYHAIDSVKGLVAFAQAGVVEFHPWGCRKGDPEVPERLIFDLDPDVDLAFPQVMNAAREMRDRLADLGFTPFIKTTGGKGLHVVVAITGSTKKPPSWSEAKAFAKALCDAMAVDAPQRYTTNMSKKQRGGRVFLDYLRNDRSATAVGAWSPRGRDGATIATPIKWSAVKAGLDPKAFRIDTAAKILKGADPWKDLARSAVSLETARKKLGG